MFLYIYTVFNLTFYLSVARLDESFVVAVMELVHMRLAPTSLARISICIASLHCDYLLINLIYHHYPLRSQQLMRITYHHA